MKFVHDNHIHVYYVFRMTFGGYQVKSGNTSLHMNADEYKDFCIKLKNGGWYESTRS